MQDLYIKTNNEKKPLKSPVTVWASTTGMEANILQSDSGNRTDDVDKLLLMLGKERTKELHLNDEWNCH